MSVQQEAAEERGPGLVARATGSRLVWPVLALVALLVLNVVVNPRFLSVELRGDQLYGSLVDILKNGAPVLLVAVGMTLVIATRGIDLSVGAVVAISGAVACTMVVTSADPTSPGTALVAMTTALGVCVVLGLWNGFLVSVVGIQPIIATLVLMTAGRGIAMLITDAQIITINNPTYNAVGAGFLLLPVPILISVGVLVVVGLLTRRTALGLFIEAVGINPEASRLAGLRSRTILWTVYVFSGLCAGVAGLMISANVNAADANNAGLWIELDAILAVVIGGTSLAGGRYSLTGTLVGAMVIQTLTTTVYSIGVPPEVSLVFKAVVVILVFLAQSPQARGLLRRRRRPPSGSSSGAKGTPPAGGTAPHEGAGTKAREGASGEQERAEQQKVGQA